MDEKRRLQRKHLRHQLMVFDRNTDELTGYLVDITPEGLLLTTKNPVEVGAILNLRMALPDKIRGSREVVFDAQSVWCRKDALTSFCKTGLKVLEIANGEAETIQLLIKMFGSPDRFGRGCGKRPARLRKSSKG